MTLGIVTRRMTVMTKGDSVTVTRIMTVMTKGESVTVTRSMTVMTKGDSGDSDEEYGSGHKR